MDNRTNTKPTTRKLIISGNSGNESISKKQIVCFKYYRIGTLVYLIDGSHHLLKENIEDLKRILNNDDFFVLDKKTMINIRYIEAIFPRRICLKNGEEYDIGPTKREALFKHIERTFEVESKNLSER